MNSFSLTRYLFVILVESVDTLFVYLLESEIQVENPTGKIDVKGKHTLLYIAQIFSLRFTCKNEKQVEPLMSQKPTYYVL